MRKSNLKYLSALLLTVSLFASPLAANAQTQRCELDWDCSGFVTFHDVYKHQSGGLAQVKSTGFYADVYYYTVYHNTYPEYVDGGYFHQYMQCGTAGNLDWNGDGVIDMTDAYEGSPSAAKLDNFYTQWFVWEYYHRSYDYFYPDSDCQADQPGSCEGKCGEFGGGANLYPCWCDDQCAEAGDCCDDYEDYCVEVNACEGIGDNDGDGVCNDIDNCPDTPNPQQVDTYGDSRGDACEPISCDPGYEAHGVNCVDIDECAVGTDNCDPNATCANIPGSFNCACNAGYNGNGVTCTDIDECAMGTDSCHDIETCTNTDGGYHCSCDSYVCHPVDECALGTHNCDPNATCTNQPGSFTCSCNPGYEGDGVTCTDVDECALGTDNCDQTADCVNTEGSFECLCPPGSTGDPETCCIDEDECVLGTHNCDPNAYCTNLIYSFTCTCMDGYTGDGVTCVDDNECVLGTHDCGAGFQCNNIPGSWTCTDINECMEGTDNCDPMYFTCENTVGSFTCVCIDSDGDGMCNNVDPCPNDQYNNCCESAADCAVDEYCDIDDETCGSDGQCTPLPATCDDTAAPLCGCDGMVYFSECEADFADVPVASLDVCAVPLPCVDNTECPGGEFCHTDGYCMARPENCPLTVTGDFCGFDGVMYDNYCLLAAAGTAHDVSGMYCETGDCNYHSDCFPNQYCAGLGCGTDLTCDPFLPDGMCVPKPDIADCAGAGISPTCGCDYNFYLNECELEAAGVRYQGAGLCTPASCNTDADCPCGLTCIGDMAKQCLPS